MSTCPIVFQSSGHYVLLITVLQDSLSYCFHNLGESLVIATKRFVVASISKHAIATMNFVVAIRKHAIATTVVAITSAFCKTSSACIKMNHCTEVLVIHFESY